MRRAPTPNIHEPPSRGFQLLPPRPQMCTALTQARTPPNKNHHNKDFICQAGALSTGLRQPVRSRTQRVCPPGEGWSHAPSQLGVGGLGRGWGAPGNPDTSPTIHFSPQPREPLEFNQYAHSKINNPFLRVCPLRALPAWSWKGRAMQTRIPVHWGNTLEFPLCLRYLTSSFHSGAGLEETKRNSRRSPGGWPITYLSGSTLAPTPGCNSSLSSRLLILSLSSPPLCLLFMLLPLHEMLFPSPTSHVCVCVCVCARALSPVGPIDCNLSGSSVHGVFQAKILECCAISYSRSIFPPQGSNLSHLSLLNLLLWQQILNYYRHLGSPHQCQATAYSPLRYPVVTGLPPPLGHLLQTPKLC